MTIAVSVVVPTFRRPTLLQRCLAALLEQEFQPSEYEIIVVDDAVCDDTRRLVECWSECGHARGTCVRYMAARHTRGPAAARNIGWRAARGAIVAFTDDDCIPDANWLGAGVGAFRDGVVGVDGRVVVPLPPVPTDYQRNEAGLEIGEFVTANCFYRRAALAEVGGFDERFATSWREDSDLFFTLLKQNGNATSHLVSEPKAVVVHPVRPAAWGVSLRQQRKSMFNALLYKKHPQLYRERIQAAPPWHYYRIVLALLVTVGAVLTGYKRLAWRAAGVWLGLTGQFCARRLRHTSHSPQHVAEMVVTSAIIPPQSVFWRLYGAVKFRVFFL